jgi:hypothetical protein
MGRILLALLLVSATALATQNAPPRDLVGQSAPLIDPGSVSFNKDVYPLLQKNCQVCHRPGEAAPMSFLTYESTRPWAKAIKQAVVTRKMPPWFADPGHGSFRNDPSLTGQEIAILSAWADNGAPEGDPQDKPRAIQWTSGWRIYPDVIISIPEAHRIPAKGSGEIKAFTVPNPFPQDTWVSAIEVRPGNASVVHHVMVQVLEDVPVPAFSWGGVGAGCALLPVAQNSPVRDFSEQQSLSQRITNTIGRIVLEESGSALPTLLNGATSPQQQQPRAPRNFAILEAVYAPGSAPMDFGMYDSAKLIRGGGDLRIEVHYTPNGTATTDQTKIGFKLAKEPPKYRYVTLAPRSLANTARQIPAGEQNWETRGELEFGQDAQLVWLMPHMHLRGKDMAFNLVGQNGNEQTILDAKFDFNWQLGYEMYRPLRVQKGTRMMVVAHHDNSANNKYNPDPTAQVSWGDLTSQEMVLPWFGMIVNKDADPEKILAIRQGGCSTPLGAFPSLPGALRTPGAPGAIRPVRVPGVIPTLPQQPTR